jgi:hypothetical protein
MTTTNYDRKMCSATTDDANASQVLDLRTVETRAERRTPNLKSHGDKLNEAFRSRSQQTPH